MTCRVRLFGTIQPLPTDGMYLRSYDPEADDGRGKIAVTANRAEARQFADVKEVLQTWKQVPRSHPTRASDGKPNRPLAAYTMCVVDDSVSDDDLGEVL